MQRYTHYEESHLKNPLHTTQHNNSYVEQNVYLSNQVLFSQKRV